MKKLNLWVIALVLLATMVACSAPTPTEAPAEEAAEEEAAVEEAPMEEAGEVEVFSWWTGGGEAAGLDAMIEVFGEEYPDIEFINAAVAGGAGTNARAVLATRLQASDPPDSWQAHAGQEIIGTYVAGGQIEPLNFLYEEEGWLDVMPETLIPLISEGDDIYSVPVNIHRANVMWYNPALLDELGVEVPTTWDEFFEIAPVIEEAGYIPMAMGEQWTVMHLMEVVLLGELGPDAYNGLWTGETDWGSAEVTAALETFNQILEYTNADAASLSWQDAAQLVANGDAAFNIMGDWVDGYFSGDTTGGNLGLVPGEGYGWASPPGTDGTFQFLSDSFVLATNAPHRDASLAWLKIAGSKEGQEAFNPVKGSICARTDCDPELFNVYLKSATEDWANDTVVGSLTHGVTANDTWKDEINTALGLFLTDYDVATFQSALSVAAGGAEMAAPAEEPAEDVGAGAEQVEVFSWWTGGGEAAGLDAMIEVFGEAYPGVEFINAAVAGGAGTNARAVLATRLQANDPPDSWQAHAGQEIIGTYVAGGQIEPLNFLYEQEGWLDVMPETLIPLISQDGDIYSVPVNIHRANVMWYNPALLDELGVEVPTTWDEFFEVAPAIEEAGYIPMALGEQWTVMHLMEVVLLGELGPDAYNGLWTGETDWGSAEVTAAIETFSQVLEYTNADAASLSWQDAAQLVANGDAAFNIMGDWVDGYFSGDVTGGNLGLVPGEGYGWAPPPGTDGTFQFLSDSFVLAVGAPDRAGALAWLSIAGSKEGQEAFNPVKGSICARTDCDPELFNVYLTSAAEDWANDTVVGSLTHGVTANDTWKDEINTALGLFLTDYDIATFQAALVDACASAGPCD